MKIYFTASTSANGEFAPYYKKIISLIKQHRLILTSGEQIVDKNLLDKDKQLTSEEIFKREKGLIDESDMVIAEVTKPSIGVGSEIVYALVNRKPVLTLVQADYEDKISPMIAGNPSENLFIEYYKQDNLRFVLNDFIKHIKKIKERKGKLIVIDGGDGSGKTTQASLLVAYLKKRKIPTKYIDFPQYYNSFHGRLVGRFLQGEFGNIEQVSPYLASLAYALDRVSVKKEIDDFLNKGGFIISNRYVTSSLAHQGAKFTDDTKRKEFLKWLYTLEYKVHKMPKEDLVIYLYVPWQIGMKLTEKKGDRKYLAGAAGDIAEKDINHRIETEKMYLSLAKKYKHWVKIDCVTDNKILPPEIIHQKILHVTRSFKA